MSYDSIITVGCSFTYNSEMTWVSQLLQRVDIPVFNGATCASSNQNIVRTAMYHIEKYKVEYIGRVIILNKIIL